MPETDDRPTRGHAGAVYTVRSDGSRYSCTLAYEDYAGDGRTEHVATVRDAGSPEAAVRLARAALVRWLGEHA